MKKVFQEPHQKKRQRDRQEKELSKRSFSQSTHAFGITARFRAITSARSRHRYWSKQKESFFNLYYSKKKYIGDPIKIIIPKRIGLEENLPGFLNFAENVIDLNSRSIIFDFQDCDFFWPSSVILLCSLSQWCNITRGHPEKYPELSSNNSKSSEVNSYLKQCGFYDYVGREAGPPAVVFDDEQAVKIVRETSMSNFRSRHSAISKLLTKFSTLTEKQIEDFKCSILTEIMLNVTEHGMNFFDQGWYSLTQYRPTTGLISLCIADNGVGIKNSLLSGPQSAKLRANYPVEKDNDSELILEAIKENVSGAWSAEIKSRMKFSLKPRAMGSKRGHG